MSKLDIYLWYRKTEIMKNQENKMLGLNNDIREILDRRKESIEMQKAALHRNLNIAFGMIALGGAALALTFLCKLLITVL